MAGYPIPGTWPSRHGSGTFLASARPLRDRTGLPISFYVLQTTAPQTHLVNVGDLQLGVDRVVDARHERLEVELLLADLRAQHADEGLHGDERLGGDLVEGVLHGLRDECRQHRHVRVERLKVWVVGVNGGECTHRRLVRVQRHGDEVERVDLHVAVRRFVRHRRLDGSGELRDVALQGAWECAEIIRFEQRFTTSKRT